VVDIPATFGGLKPGQASDNQSVRWTGEIFLATPGDYTFFITSLGPQRLTVGDVVVVDDVAAPSNTTRSGVYTATTPGLVSLSYEAADLRFDAAQARLEWSTPDNPARRLLHATETPHPGPDVLAASRQVLRYAPGLQTTGLDDDFHLMSTAASYHGGSWTADAVDSPAIDAGNPALALTETAPTAGALATQHGGRINLGFEANTPQASRSRASLIQLLTFTGAEKVRATLPTPILWRSVGVASTVDILFSADNGQTFTPIAVAEPNDGQFTWTPTIVTNRGRLRIVATGNPAVSDTSHGVFAVGVAGHDDYVNDASTTGDRLTAAVGDNANSGTTPNDPVRSIYTLLHSYDMDPGDVIHVDTGTYLVPINILIGAEDSGVAVIGPGPDATALLNRNNTSGHPSDDERHYVIELAGATDVTVDGLSLINAEQGLHAEGAARLRLQNTIAFNNANWGFFLDRLSTDVVIRGNQAFGTTGNQATDQDTGIEARGNRLLVENNVAFKIGVQFGNGIVIGNFSNDLHTFGTTVRNNLAHNNVNGMLVYGGQVEVGGNEARDNDLGLYVVDYDPGPGDPPSLVHDNFVHDNDVEGLVLERTVDASANVVRANDGTGISVRPGFDTFVHDNVVSASTTGIYADSGATVFHNRVFGNSGSGIVTVSFSGNVTSNFVYGNAVGIEVVNFQTGPTIAENLVYDNTNQGIYVHDAAINTTQGVRLLDNTVQHDVGSAIKLQNNGANFRLFNNVVVINTGLGIEVIGGVTGFDSDYNDIFRGTPGASVGRWLGVLAPDLAAWRAATAVTLGSARDSHSLSQDPLFVDIDGADNLLGWDRQSPQSPFANFGDDDNFHLRAGSPVIDAANSDPPDGPTAPAVVAPATDLEGRRTRAWGRRRSWTWGRSSSRAPRSIRCHRGWSMPSSTSAGRPRRRSTRCASRSASRSTPSTRSLSRITSCARLDRTAPSVMPTTRSSI